MIRDEKEYILCFIDVLERLSFFNRLNTAFKKSSQNSELIFVTNKLSIYLKGKKQGNIIYLCRKTSSSVKSKINLREIKNTIELLSGGLDIKGTELFYNSIYKTMNQLFNDYRIKGIFNWNGGGISGLASRKIAQKNKLPILFFEIGNFPGKLFVDLEGTNSDASIAKNPKLLLKYKGNKKEYKIWKQNFIEKRSKIENVPQAEKVNKINFWYAIDWVGYLFGCARAEDKSVFNKIAEYLKTQYYKRLLNALNTEILPKNFAYFPLQVYDDTNVLLRSDCDNICAIKKALTFAKKKSIPLVIKLHPAEKNPLFLKEIYSFLQSSEGKKNIILSYENAVILAEKSKYIFTINSTLGLEAKILGRKIFTLGRCLYDKWTEEHIMRYIQGFLIDASYFSSEEISNEAAEDIFNRLD